MTYPAAPADYDVMDGIKYAFALPDGTGSCWMITGARTASGDADAGAPLVNCALPFANDAPLVFDRLEGSSGPPTGLVIDGLGAWGTWIQSPSAISPKTLPVGASLTVSHMTCEMLGESSVRCAAQTGEFLFQGGKRQSRAMSRLERRQPAPA